MNINMLPVVLDETFSQAYNERMTTHHSTTRQVMSNNSAQQEKFYADLMSGVIQGILKKYADYFVQQSSYDTGGMYGEPWKRHVTYIFKSKAARNQALAGGIFKQIEADTQQAVTAVNAKIGSETPIDLYSVGSADIDDINAAGGYFNYFH